ncbi:hypothetical protein SKAU_G00340530 [Synaphobranchus kaupii]|uniref:FMN hydroxy acid dehydrogenase domain-containing protein n=1 Tax=Synaphobranchus kaupii TaxID=118154 RepID=A0A9Q1IJ61_SYNKA|nr:hypothetical protein SKAU_G00340530 [Synaphobranchus kaupii]
MSATYECPLYPPNRRWRLYPRVLRDVSQVDMSVSVLGQRLSMPVCVAATAMQRMAHPDGETATMRGMVNPVYLIYVSHNLISCIPACSSTGTGMMLSCFATSTIEEVAEAGPAGVRWLQLHIFKDRNLTISLVRQAERACYTGIFVTVDMPYVGRRRYNMHKQFKFPSNHRAANFDVHVQTDTLLDPTMQWEDIAWLKKMTSLPVVLKGVLTAEDAKLALQYGVDGILVSNHGARQLALLKKTA